MTERQSLITNYKFKTIPDPHQLQYLQEHAFTPNYGLFWEMGVAKTKPMIDNIGILYEAGEIDGALIVALSGLDLNWVIDEIPKHLSDHVAKQSRVFRYSSSKSKTKWHQDQVRFTREHHGLAIMVMTYDAFMTLDGKEAALKFLEKRKTFYVLDESSAIKTPGAKRTMRITRTAHRAKYRRILDGQPAPKSAFDLYSQIEFLQNDFWEKYGWNSAAAFRSYFGVFEKSFNRAQGQQFDKLIGFNHLEELRDIIKTITSRLLKKDTLDLPPKIYNIEYFKLTANQRKLYDELEEEFRIYIDDQLVTANLAMVRMLRLQQISCGYVPTPDGENPTHMIPGGNPRLDQLEQILDRTTTKTIIWVRYQKDIDLIRELLQKKSNQLKFVVYDGRTNDEERIRAKREFQEGDADIFLGTPSAAGVGLTLHAAQNVIFYSNSYNLRHRLQAEDRAHRRGLLHPVNYIDLFGEETQDRNIILNMIAKMETADTILGDTDMIDIRQSVKEWFK